MKKCVFSIIIFIIILVSFSRNSFAENITDIFNSGDQFISNGEGHQNPEYNQDGTIKTPGTIETDKLKEGINMIYTIFIGIGVAIASIVGVILGMKLMTAASADEKAKYKQAIITYVIGCIVIFGAFGIWKMVVDTLNVVV